LAATLATFLDRSAGVRVFFGEGEMRPGEDLAAKAREARMADIVVPLLSRNSVPVPWPRSQWEGALIDEPKAEGVRIAFLRCADYTPPRVLAPQFDGRSLKGWRELKRWIRDRVASYVPPETPPCSESGDLETLSATLADRPGSATVASVNLAFEFARVSGADFDEILRLECQDRTLAALAGDLAAQLGLRLEGELENNLARLRDFCSARRFLLLLDGVLSASAMHEFVFGGRCSTLLCAEPGPHVGTPEEDALRSAQRVLLDAKNAGFGEVCRAAQMGRSLLRDQGRIAEMYELMRQWYAAAELRGDLRILDESSREMVWILEGWGRYDEARRLDYHRVAECGEQMFLPLGDF
jgi:hypothetical protein